MTVTILTPEQRGQLVELGNGRFRKQLLPLGSITYKGRKIKFDNDYLAGLVKSFKQRACGPVPFQLADAQNTHTNDPERRRGTVVDLEVNADGLDAIVELDEDGAKLIEKYPDLGVSARIYEDYERSDGKFWQTALQHVLGTLDPHISGMRPWQAVALSSEIPGPVIDLSDTEFDAGREEQEQVATKGTLKEILAKLRETGDETELTDEELDQLLAITDAMSESGKPEAETELTDAELDQLIADAEADLPESESDSSPDSEGDEDDSPTEEEGGDDVTKADPDPRLVAASQENRAALELANAQLEQQQIKLAAVTAKLAAQEFQAEQLTFAREYGIPPRVTEFARPLLEGGEGHVIQLANGDEVDAGAVMRKVLMELGSTIKALDLSELLGRSDDEPANDETAQREAQTEETRKFVDEVRGSYSF